MLFNFRAVWLFISTFLISVTPSQFICPVHIYTICFLVTRISVDSYLISVQHFRILPLYTVTTFSLIDTPTTLVVNITSFNSMGDLTGNDAMVDEDHVLNDLVCRRLDWDSFIDGVDQTAHSGTTVDDSFVSRVTDSNFIPLRGGAKMRAKVTSKRMTTKNTTPRKKYKMIKRKTPTKKKGETNQESSSDEQSGSEGSPKDKTPRSKCIIIRRKTPIKEIEKNQESSSDRESGSDNSTMSADITGGYENPPGNPPKKKARGRERKKQQMKRVVMVNQKMRERVNRIIVTVVKAVTMIQKMRERVDRRKVTIVKAVTMKTGVKGQVMVLMVPVRKVEHLQAVKVVTLVTLVVTLFQMFSHPPLHTSK